MPSCCGEALALVRKGGGVQFGVGPLALQRSYCLDSSFLVFAVAAQSEFCYFVVCRNRLGYGFVVCAAVLVSPIVVGICSLCRPYTLSYRLRCFTAIHSSVLIKSVMYLEPLLEEKGSRSFCTVCWPSG